MTGITTSPGPDGSPGKADGSSIEVVWDAGTTNRGGSDAEATPSKAAAAAASHRGAEPALTSAGAAAANADAEPTRSKAGEAAAAAADADAGRGSGQGAIASVEADVADGREAEEHEGASWKKDSGEERARRGSRIWSSLTQGRPEGRDQGGAVASTPAASAFARAIAILFL